MSAFVDHTFGPDEVVQLDGNQFTRCTFDRCHVEYAGGPVSVVGCRFHDPVMVFVGPAEGTVKFLRDFGALDGGRVFLDAVVRQLRGEQEIKKREASATSGVTLH